MDPENVVVKLCAQGMAAEAAGRATEARDLFHQAWEAAANDYEACVAAHYLARHQPTAEETLRWNQECLARADRVGDDRVRGFYASLHGNMGRAHLDLGQPDKAREHFAAAVTHLPDVPAGQYADWLRLCIARGLRATDPQPPPQDDPVRTLLAQLCERSDLDSLALLLPPYLSSVGRPEDEERITTALTMLHAERRLPEPEHTILRAAIAHRTRSGVAAPVFGGKGAIDAHTYGAPGARERPQLAEE